MESQYRQLYCKLLAGVYDEEAAKIDPQQAIIR